MFKTIIHPINIFKFFLTWKLKNTVYSGPYKGMIFPPNVISGSYFPKLLGTYEKEIHLILSKWKAKENSLVWVIGCAEGYHAVGLALHLPNAHIRGVDKDKIALEEAAFRVESNKIINISLDNDIRTLLVDISQPPTHILMDIEGEEWLYFKRINELHPYAHWIIEVHSEDILSQFMNLKEKKVNWLPVVPRSLLDYPDGVVPPPVLRLFRRYFSSLIQEWRSESLGWIIIESK